MKKIMLLSMGGAVVNNHGGAERVLCDMANKFVELGCEVYTLCYDAQTGKPAFYLDDKVNFINLNTSGKKIKIPLWRKVARGLLRVFRQPHYGLYIVSNPVEMYECKIIAEKLKKQIERIQPDRIICYELRGLGARYMSGYVSIPTVSMCHIDAQEMVSKLWKYPKLCLEQVDIIQVLLPCFEKIISNTIKAKRIIVVPNIVPQIENIRSFKRLADKEIFKIVSVGGINPNKQQHLIIEAFALLSNKNHNWNIYLYGSMDNKKYISRLKKAIQKHNLQGRVYFCGVVDDIDEIFQDADIFAFPSKSEGFGLALTEAMSYGVPCVVVKDCMATSYIVGSANGGLLCENNVKSFSEALDELMNNNKLRTELGTNALIGVADYYKEVVHKGWRSLAED